MCVCVCVCVCERERERESNLGIILKKLQELGIFNLGIFNSLNIVFWAVLLGCVLCAHDGDGVFVLKSLKS